MLLQLNVHWLWAQSCHPIPDLAQKLSTISQSNYKQYQYIFSVYDADDISLFLRKFNGKRFKIVKFVFSVEIFKSLNLGRQEAMTREVMGSSGREKECLFSFYVVTHDKTRQYISYTCCNLSHIRAHSAMFQRIGELKINRMFE